MTKADLFGLIGGYGIIFATTFTTTFLRGYQNKNVQAGHKRMAALFGFGMSVCEIGTITLVGAVAANAVRTGDHMFTIYSAIAGGAGSSLGWVLSMVVHDRVMRKRNAERDELKKLRKRSKQEERIRDVLRDELDDLEAKGIITINRQ
jgi:hypothetical protein